MQASQLACLAHKRVQAVNAARHSEIDIGTRAKRIAVGDSRAVWCLTAWALPSWLAVARRFGSIALSISRARLAKAHAIKVGEATRARVVHLARSTRAVARTAGNVAQLAPVATQIVTDAHIGAGNRLGHNSSVARAFRVATHARPARVTSTETRVDRILKAVHTWCVAVTAHPSLIAELANWLRQVVVARSLAKAVGLAGAVWCLASWASPAWVALTRGQGSIALAVARARLTKPHAVLVTEITDAHRNRSAGNIEARAVSGTSRLLTERSPVALAIIANANVVGIDSSNITALCVTSDTVEAWQATAVSRVLWNFLAVQTWLAAVDTHPRALAVDATHQGRKQVWIAHTTAKAVVLAIGNRAGNSSPSGMAGALGKSGVALAMAGAVCVVEAWATRNIAQVATESRQEVAHAVSILTNSAVARAFSVASITRPTSLAHTLARKWRVLNAIDTR